MKMGEFNWAAVVAAGLTAAVAITLYAVSARRDPRALKLLKDLDAVLAAGGDARALDRLRRVRSKLLNELAAQLDPQSTELDRLFRYSMIVIAAGVICVIVGLAFSSDGNGGLTPWFLGVVIGMALLTIATAGLLAMALIGTITYLIARRTRRGPPPEYDI